MSNFYKDEKAENIYKELGKPEGKKEKLFESMKDVYMLSLLLGIKYEENNPIEKKSSDPIKEEIFGEENIRIMNMLALYMTKDINILNKSEESEKCIHNMMENYANGGIFKFYELLDGNLNNLDGLISFVKNLENKEQEIKKVDIADLLNDVTNHLE